ncbi:alpha-1,2-mannosyltransferase Alg9p [[Candida] railenensis]|uniref:Mannosyltransferase n=1 Tax=[Candida] railenensis TaxID=45579 RepID=A0A9P0QMD0_9ASCO|nr:alpha-1,2-mannosyltransferase Alg9p [[Candida] railenensis]
MARTPNSRLQWVLISLNWIVRSYCALYMIISDCDETFNYWEPLNLLIRGFGKQTWEYSPEYAIRSYFYLVPYYILAYPLQLMSFSSVAQFYWIRFVALCGFTAYTEFSLFTSIQKNLGSSKIANWFLFFSTIAPGMSHASVALLPSSLAMNCVTLASANVLSAMNQQPHQYRASTSVLAIAQFCVGGVIGWPFALVLAVPFGIYTVGSNILKDPSQLFKIITGSIMSLGAILAAITSIDSWFYQKLVLVPLNIVLYNVFGGEGEGPEIFGVEDFSYYVLNLLLNFNIVFILGYSGSILNPLFIGKKAFLVSTCPLLLWSLIFGSQPHKEERFLYPIYPLICLNASILISFIFTTTSNVLESIKLSNKWVSRSIQLLFGGVVGLVSILRIFNLVENYSAPLTVAEDLYRELVESGNGDANVCVGREWYHYPNSFFLSSNSRLKFVKSGFNGLLPGDFLEDEDNLSSISDVTSSIPFDMNNKNQFSDSKVTSFNQCSYYIDNTLPVDLEQGEHSIIELSKSGEVIVNDNDWELLACSKLISMDGNSSGLGKILWIPHYFRKFIAYRVEYMQYCALKKKE